MTARSSGVGLPRWIIVVGVSLWHFFASVRIMAAAVPPITAVAFTPDGTEVVAGSQAGLEMRSWPALAHAVALPTQLANIHDLAFSPDGKLLAVAGGEPGVDGALELYRWPQKNLLRRDNPHDDVVYAVAWQSDGKVIALASGDQRIGLVNTSTAEPTRYVEGHSRAVLATAFLPQDGVLLSGGVDETIHLWDPATGMSQRALTNHTRAVNDLKVRPDLDSPTLPMVASAGDDRTVRFWQPTIGRLIRFARLDSAALELAWTADGRILWAACRDGRLRGIDPENATVKTDSRALEGVAYALAVAPDGSILIAGSNGQLRRIVVRKDGVSTEDATE